LVTPLGVIEALVVVVIVQAGTGTGIGGKGKLARQGLSHNDHPFAR